MSTTLAAGTATSGAALSSDTSGILQLQSGSTPTTAVTIDTSQNVGVGVTPSAWTSAFKVVEIGSKGGALAGASGEVDLFNNAYNNGSSTLYGISSYATQFQMNNLGQFRWYTAPSGSAGGTVSFTQAMTLDNSGHLFLNSVPSGTGYTLQWNNSTSAINYLVSSRKYKTNIQDTKYGLADVLKMRPVTFNYISDNSVDIGFIAEEMAEIIPEVAILKDGAPDSIRYSQLYSVFAKAIQELSAQVTSLQTTVTALQAKVGA